MIVELAQCSEKLLSQDPRVVAVGLFGSLARRQATPSSDADILIALKTHPLGRWFDRTPEYAIAFEGTSLPVEPFPYTLEELTQLLSCPGFLRTILREILPLAGNPKVWKCLQKPLGAETVGCQVNTFDSLSNENCRRLKLEDKKMRR